MSATYSLQPPLAAGFARLGFGALPLDPTQRARQARFLAARGFSGEVVRKVLNTPDDE